MADLFLLAQGSQQIDLAPVTDAGKAIALGVGAGLGSIGAGVGIGIDALIRGRKTIYDTGHGSTRLDAAPLVGRGAAGLQVSLSF